MSRFFGRENHHLFVSVIACQLSYSVGSSWVFSNICGWRIFSQIWKPWRKAVLPFLSAVTSSSAPFHCSPGLISAVSLNFWIELDAYLPPVNKSAKLYQHDKIITVLAVIVKNTFEYLSYVRHCTSVLHVPTCLRLTTNNCSVDEKTEGLRVCVKAARPQRQGSSPRGQMPLPGADAGRASVSSGEQSSTSSLQV